MDENGWYSTNDWFYCFSFRYIIDNFHRICNNLSTMKMVLTWLDYLCLSDLISLFCFGASKSNWFSIRISQNLQIPKTSPTVQPTTPSNRHGRWTFFFCVAITAPTARWQSPGSWCPLGAQASGRGRGGLRNIPISSWLVVSTPLKNISQLG